MLSLSCSVAAGSMIAGVVPFTDLFCESEFDEWRWDDDNDDFGVLRVSKISLLNVFFGDAVSFTFMASLSFSRSLSTTFVGLTLFK